MTDQYIITEQQLKDLAELPHHHTLGICNMVRSHPYNPQAERCIPITDNKMCEMCSEHERKDEREKVLDELIEWLNAMAEISNDTAHHQENYVEATGNYGRMAGLLQAKERAIKLRQEGKQ